MFYTHLHTCFYVFKKNQLLGGMAAKSRGRRRKVVSADSVTLAGAEPPADPAVPHLLIRITSDS